MSKKLIIVALAVAMSAGLAQAADVTNITGSVFADGVYNISPERQYDTAGYRHYENFTLAEGDVANLKFENLANHTKEVNTFVNLVDSNININGVLNSTRNGGFFNGHAVFITPGKFTLGNNGVLNVGQLSIGLPKSETYDEMMNGYGGNNFNYAEKIGQRISKLATNSDGSAAANDIDLRGTIFTQGGIQQGSQLGNRLGIQMAGQNVSVDASIVHGLRSGQVFSDSDTASALFHSLVGQAGEILDANAFNFTTPGKILIKSENKMTGGGTVSNSGDIYLTNRGTGGMDLNGRFYSGNLLRMYNTKGDLVLNNQQAIKNNKFTGKKVVIQNKGANLTVDKSNDIVGTQDVHIINQGSGAMTVKANVSAEGSLKMINYGSGMTVGDKDTLIENNSSSGETELRNHRGAMSVDGVVNTKGDTNILNMDNGTGLTITKNATVTHSGSGKMDVYNKGANGLTVVGKVNNTGNLRIMNDAGQLTLGNDGGSNHADITNSNGDVKIVARGTSTGLFQASDVTVQNTRGNISIRNKGTGVPSGERGLDLQGTVKTVNSGVIAINNNTGDMYVGGNVTSAGNMGIINRAGGGDVMLASPNEHIAGSGEINGGNINIKNYADSDMNVNSTITHNGRVNVLANGGSLTLGGKVHNNSGALGANGGFYAAARHQNNTAVSGKGILVSTGFEGDGTGEYLIRNITGDNGLTFNGKINTTGANQVAVVNRKGNMTFNNRSEVTSTGGQVVISSKGDNGKLTITNEATISSGSGTRGILYVEPASTGHAGQLDPSIGTSAAIHRMDGHGKLLGRNWD